MKQEERPLKFMPLKKVKKHREELKEIFVADITVGEIVDGTIENNRGLFLRIHNGIVNLSRANFVWDLTKTKDLKILVYQRNGKS